MRSIGTIGNVPRQLGGEFTQTVGGRVYPDSWGESLPRQLGGEFMSKFDAYLDEETEAIAREIIEKERGLYSKIVRQALKIWKAENISGEELSERIIEEESRLQQRTDFLKQLKGKKKTLDEIKERGEETEKAELEKIKKEFKADYEYVSKHLKKFYKFNKKIANSLAQDFIRGKNSSPNPRQYDLQFFLSRKAITRPEIQKAILQAQIEEERPRDSELNSKQEREET